MTLSRRVDGFAEVCLGTDDWSGVPESPGVYVVLERKKPVYVGMAGRRGGEGAIQSRLKDHASGQLVNMFVQYVLFHRVLRQSNPPQTPDVARDRCKEYVRSNFTARYRKVGLEHLREWEEKLIRRLNPEFNGIDARVARDLRRVPAWTHQQIANEHNVPKSRVYSINRRIREGKLLL